MISKYGNIDTPSLIVDYDIMMDNIKFMQNKADKYNVKLRPHTKTHKMPEIAKIQLEAGASGIAVAKVGEAEVMADHGISDIFIANEIVGKSKLERIKELSRKVNISFGVDCIEQIEEIDEVFKADDLTAKVLIEIEVGENRSGIIEENDFTELVKFIHSKKNVKLLGLFSHDGHSYHAETVEDCRRIFEKSQLDTLKFVQIANDLGQKIEVVSIGSTPSLMFDFEILKGITEIRPGTYVFMDASQGNIIGTYERCAATVLTTVISKPTSERVITDAGAKALTSQGRSGGMCATKGKGYVKGSNSIYVDNVFDEHGIIYNKEFRDSIKIGDKIEIVPNHICPVCNLYDKAYLVSEGAVLREIEISCRGKIL